MAKASDNLFPYVHLTPAAAPASPAAGSQRLYLDSGNSNKLSRKDSSGTVVVVEGGSASAPSWGTYTPVWSAASGTTNVGSTGAITGRWVQWGKTIHFSLNLVLGGTGISTGTGAWSFTLPPAAHVAVPTGIGNHGLGGGGYFEDSGVRAYGIASVRLKASSTTSFEVLYSADASATPGGALNVGAAAPFAWGAADYLSLYATYEAA